MRLPLVPDIETRDGATTKDAKLTNVLVEDDSGVKLAGIRPGLSAVATASGAGNGLVAFNGELISVFGTTVGYGTTPTSTGTVSGSNFDFAQSPL